MSRPKSPKTLKTPESPLGAVESPQVSCTARLWPVPPRWSGRRRRRNRRPSRRGRPGRRRWWRRTSAAAPPALDVLTVERSGSDFMVDVLKSIGFAYATANPGSSFRGLHESIINYGGNVAPEWLTCCHEESSVAMAHGYAKIAGTPLLVAAHGTVGLQHAAMAVYNAFCDRVPVFIVLGNTFDATQRRPGAEWVHSVQDGGGDGAGIHQVG